MSTVFSINIDDKKNNYLLYVIIASLSAWFLLIAVSFFIKNGASKISILAARIEFGVHFITLSLLVYLLFILKKRNKHPVVWLFFINIWLFFVDLFFYIAAYADNTYLLKMSLVQFFLYYSPCIIYCIIMIVFLIRILLHDVLKKETFIKILCVLIFINIITALLFFSSFQYAFGVISWESISQMTLLGAELLLFDFAVLGLLYADSISIFLLLSGTIILIIGDFFLTYSSISQTVALFSYGELFWLLGLLFIMFSIFSIIQNKDYFSKQWFRPCNMIKSRLAMWSVTTSITGFLFFFVIAYVFSIVNRQIFIGLPLFIMMYSIIAVGFSLFMGKKFEIPFNILMDNIKIFMNEHDKARLNRDFSIEEFVFLNKFVIDAIEAVEEKDRAKKELGEISGQMAHDIRSPLTAIQTFIESSESKLEEKDRLFLRNAFRRISDISQSAVARYKGQEQINENRQAYVLLAICIFEIISEKRVEYKNTAIEFDYVIEPNAYFTVTYGNGREIKRMLSNLINNSVNAMPDGGNITVTLNNTPFGLFIEIKDQGFGMTEERIRQLIAHNPDATAKIGLGLTQAKNYVKTHGGEIDIHSVLNEGTTVNITLPASDSPDWLCTSLNLTGANKIAVIDDDHSIHDTWDNKLLEQLKVDSGRIHHFFSPQAFLDWFNLNEDSQLIVLSDYEFLGQKQNGLDLLSAIHGVTKKILVTSHYDEDDIIEGCEKQNVKLLPKHLVPFFQVSLVEKADQPVLVFIDDNAGNIKDWNYFAGKKGLTIATFSNPEAFINDAGQFPVTIPVYIDQDLQLERDGLSYAKTIYDLGFHEIYLATGFNDIDLAQYPWIKAVRSKKPPFMD